MKKNNNKKRVRNKNNKEAENKTEIKSFLIILFIVIGFILIFFLIILGLSALGVFEEGYTKPTTENSEISYDEILIGNVFNKPENSYYVLFDTFLDETNNVYINYLITSKEYDNKIYKVDMSNPNNKKYLSNESNKKATKVSDLKINGITLIKITNKKITQYLTGSNEIEKHLENLSK